MAFNRALAVLTVALAGFVGTATAQRGRCPSVPFVRGVDQTPSRPQDYGKCTDALDTAYNVRKYSHWCKFGRMGLWPGPPSNKAQQCLKFGRATIYRGPLYGSSLQHKAACNRIIKGSNDAAAVAVSTKYLKTFEGGWAANKGACGQCMCVRLHGGDTAYNRGLQKGSTSKHIGLTFKAQVTDRCSECEDDHIDLLQDRPLTYAPFDPKKPGPDRWVPFANAKEGLRGFSNPAYIRPHPEAMESTGVWLSDWQFVPCSYTHAKCVDLMKSMGYRDAFAPKMTPGVDSFQGGRPINQLRLSGRELGRLTQLPWGIPGIDREGLNN